MTVDVVEVDMADQLEVPRAGARVFLARLDGSPAGFLHVSADRRSWVIEHVYVDPSARGRGVARALVHEAGRVKHDNRLSTAGAALVAALRLPLVDRDLPAEDLDDDVVEITGARMLGLVAAAPAIP